MGAWRYLLLALAATLCLLILLKQAHALQFETCELDAWRLPRRVLPRHYTLDMHFARSSDIFRGEVQIDISQHKTAPESCHWLLTLLSKLGKKLFSSPDRIFLHADKSLKIHHVGFVEVKGTGTTKELPVLKVCHDLDKGLIRVDLGSEFKSGLGRLSLNFTGTISQEAEGIFNSSASARPSIHTNFEPAMARKAFPCFDEPNFKATFDVSIVLPVELTAVSIMNAASMDYVASERQDYKIVRFHRTHQMSTYLLTFAVGDFDLAREHIGGMALAFWTPPGKSESARPLLHTAVLAYSYLIKYFRIEQPLTKIDFVAVDISPTAQEKGGGVNFDEALLSASQQDLSVDDWHWMELTMVNFVASLWFGNMVTMKWWDDLWLNAGFADWISHACMAKIKPEFDGKMFYLLNTMMKAFKSEALESVHPIKNSNLKTLEEIDSAFDHTTVLKSSCVIKMLETFVGKTNFEKGVKRYIEDNRYGNADADDLWTAIERESNINVANMGRSWINQAGHPLVEVSLGGGGDGEVFEILIQQRKFPFPGQRSSLGSGRSPLWIIPIIIVVWGEDRNEPWAVSFEMTTRQDTMQLPPWFDPSKHWIKLNANFEGFYRVQYDAQLYAALRQAIESHRLPPTDRLNLIDDAQALFTAGLMGEDQFLDMINWFRGEEHDGVVAGLVDALRTLSDSDSNSDSNRKKWGEDILSHYYRDNGGLQFDPEESQLKTKARADVLQYLVLVARRATVTNDCYRLYQSLTTARRPMPGPFRDTIYAAAAVKGKKAEFKQLIGQIDQIEGYQLRSITVNVVWNMLKQSEQLARMRMFERHFSKFGVN